MFGYSTAQIKDFVEIIQAVVSSLAILIGGTWVWWTFVIKRESATKAEVVHDVMHAYVTNDRVLLRVNVYILNQGQTLLNLTEGVIWVQQLYPCPLPIREQILRDEDLMKDNTEIPWTIIREANFSNSILLEPGERDQTVFDFIISDDIKRVIVYTHFRDPKSKKYGWNTTSVYTMD